MRREKGFQISREIGSGVIEGVAGPESANNAATGGSIYSFPYPWAFPSNAVMAILLGAMMIHGMQPGPRLITEHPEVFWGGDYQYVSWELYVASSQFAFDWSLGQNFEEFPTQFFSL